MKFFRQFRIKEILRFCAGGGSAVIVDFLVYMFLKNYMPASTAKAVSFICGAAVGFVINKLWTFESRKFRYGEIVRYCILYACSAMANTFVNHWVLQATGAAMPAFLAATGCSTAINFLGQKFFVFAKTW